MNFKDFTPFNITARPITNENYEGPVFIAEGSNAGRLGWWQGEENNKARVYLGKPEGSDYFLCNRDNLIIFDGFQNFYNELYANRLNRIAS
jgi:hypothetical protein